MAKRTSPRTSSGRGPSDHERGYPVAEVAARLGSASTRSMSGRSDTRSRPQPAMTSRPPRSAALKRELQRVTEERDILKKAAAYFAKDAK